jgi:hypothetical protein
MDREYTERWGFYGDEEIDTTKLIDKELQKLIQKVLDSYSAHLLEE